MLEYRYEHDTNATSVSIYCQFRVVACHCVVLIKYLSKLRAWEPSPPLHIITPFLSLQPKTALASKNTKLERWRLLTNNIANITYEEELGKKIKLIAPPPARYYFWYGVFLLAHSKIVLSAVMKYAAIEAVHQQAKAKCYKLNKISEHILD